MSKRVDPIQAAFERYIALTSEQRTIFAAQVAGYNRAYGGKASEGEPRKLGRPPGSRNKKTANGAETPAEATA